MIDEEGAEVDEAQVRADLADAAAFLLPLAHEHVRMGRWPIEVAAWLTMVRDSWGQRLGADH